MPYINQRLRVAASVLPQTVGELTYALTKIVVDYLDRHTDVPFAYYAEALGALEATKLELYRRRIAPYEDQKLRTNGDVY